KAPGLRVFIGEETGLAPLEGMSLVSAPYGRDGQVLGVLGVIGPSRMAYERVIPVVEATAAALGAARRGGASTRCGAPRRRWPDSRGRKRHPAANRSVDMSNDRTEEVSEGADEMAQQDELEALRAEVEQLRAQSLLERADLDNQRKRL